MRNRHIGFAILNVVILTFTIVIYDPKNLGNDRVYFAGHSQKTNALW